MSKKPTQSQIITRAVKCGKKPTNLNSWKKVKKKYSDGEKVVRFAHEWLTVPEGPMVGQPLVLDAYQVAFIYAVFDGDEHTRKAILTMARRNGKTFVIAVILLAAIVGPIAVPNSVIASAAMSRDQAALCFRLMSIMLQSNDELDGFYRIVPSAKRIYGLRKNVEYMALSADAKTGHGKSLRFLLLDEAGQIVEAENEYISMLRTSQGSYEDARLFIISTQAPSHGSFLSMEIDSATREQPKGVVVHQYAADEDCDIDDQAQWYFANPGLGKYRSESDMAEQINDAKAMPAKMPGVMNLLLNMRTSTESMFISPMIWKENTGTPDLEAFKTGTVCMGLDLSMVNDLTAAVLATQDDQGNYHALCYAFTPLGGIDERSRRDRVPYSDWAKDGSIYAAPGETLDYDLIAAYLRDQFEELGIEVHRVMFDRYRMDMFKAAAEREGFLTDCEFVPCGQGFVTMGKILDHTETVLLSRKLVQRHPVLNLGASSAIVEQDHTGNRRLTKKKSANKIDGMIALAQALWGFAETNDVPDDVTSWIG